MSRPLIIIESPYAGDVQTNLRYARACVKDSVERGELPFASHLFYTQEGILDDLLLKDRTLGMGLGYEYWRFAVGIAFYTDLGWSKGMAQAFIRWKYSEARGGWVLRKLKQWT